MSSPRIARGLEFGVALYTPVHKGECYSITLLLDILWFHLKSRRSRVHGSKSWQEQHHILIASRHIVISCIKHTLIAGRHRHIVISCTIIACWYTTCTIMTFPSTQLNVPTSTRMLETQIVISLLVRTLWTQVNWRWHRSIAAVRVRPTLTKVYCGNIGGIRIIRMT